MLNCYLILNTHLQLQKRKFLSQDPPDRQVCQERKDCRVRRASPARRELKARKDLSVHRDRPDCLGCRDRSARSVYRVFRARSVRRGPSASPVPPAKRHLTISPVSSWSSTVRAKVCRSASRGTSSSGRDTACSTPTATKGRILKTWVSFSSACIVKWLSDITFT